MKQGWEYKKLGEVASFFRGLTYSGKDEVSFSNNIVLRSNNIDLNTNTINFDELKFISDSIIIPKDKKLKKNSIFMCMSNGSKLHLGKVAFIDKEYPYAFGGFMGLIVPKEDELMPKMAYYYFCSQKFKTYLSSIGNGANINNIKFVDIAKDTIPIPPKSTQLSIVSELDKINELIRLKQEQLKDYDNLAQSIFYEMFGDPVENEKGWEVKKIGEIGSVERGAGISKKDFVEDGLPCIHYGQLHTILGARTKKHYTSIPHDLLPKYKVAHTGDLVMAITSEDVEGSCKSTAWLGNYDVIVGSDAAILHHEQDGTFLSYYTMTKAFYNEKAKYAKGFKVTHISTKEIEKISVFLPPLPLQHLFAQRIEQIERQRSAVQKSITDLETLLASRMQYWFE